LTAPSTAGQFPDRRRLARGSDDNKALTDLGSVKTWTLQDCPTLFGEEMWCLVEGVDRNQITLCPERLDDWIDDDPMLIIDAFLNALDLQALDCKSIMPKTIAAHILLFVR
jgi:hypothetical protein